MVTHIIWHRHFLDDVLGKLADEENGVKAYEVLETFAGKELEHKEYEPLYACAKMSVQTSSTKRDFSLPVTHM